jgi:hypothetical protein
MWTSPVRPFPSCLKLSDRHVPKRAGKSRICHILLLKPFQLVMQALRFHLASLLCRSGVEILRILCKLGHLGQYFVKEGLIDSVMKLWRTPEPTSTPNATDSADAAAATQPTSTSPPTDSVTLDRKIPYKCIDFRPCLEGHREESRSSRQLVYVLSQD